MSYLRRSGRLNANLGQNQNQNMNPGMGMNMGMNMNMKMNMNMNKGNPFGGYETQSHQQQFHRQGGGDSDKMFSQQRYFQKSQYQKQDNRDQEFTPETKTDFVTSAPKPLPVPPPLIQPSSTEFDSPKQETSSDTSASVKALNKLEGQEGGEKKRKNVKLPASVRRKKLNQRLSKVLAPKSALLLLHELKPSIVYKVQEQPGLSHPIFVATVEDNNVVLATGQGMSKSLAKNVAAENAIKNFVSKAMTQRKGNQGEDKTDGEDSVEDLPWAGLASFAMYKMFTEWQSQGADLPLPLPTPPPKHVTPKLPLVKKDLPPNALELHPTVLLNVMHPGLLAVEVHREVGPNSKVTMGYSLDGHMYTGTARNKKEAKKEAAKEVVKALYGLTYDS